MLIPKLLFASRMRVTTRGGPHKLEASSELYVAWLVVVLLFGIVLVDNDDDDDDAAAAAAAWLL